MYELLSTDCWNSTDESEEEWREEVQDHRLRDENTNTKCNLSIVLNNLQSIQNIMQANAQCIQNWMIV